MYDTSAPSSLIHLQKWFGGTISRPLTQEGEIQPVTGRLTPIETEAARYIRPSKTLQSHERIALYNKQYWWRVVGCMQETYPLVVRLYGFEIFNHEMAIPYLDKYPPHSWSLNHLGEGFSECLQDEKASSAAALDWAYHKSFVAPHIPSIREKGGDPAEWMEKPLALQPHLFLVRSLYPFLKVRKALLTEKPEEPLPKLEAQQTLYAIYRDRHSQIAHKELEEGEWNLLTAIEGGKTLAEAAELMDDSQAESLAYWIQDWILRDFLYGVERG